MTPPRYDSRKVRAELDTLAGKDNLIVATIPDTRLSTEEVQVVRQWQLATGQQAISGQPPDLGLFPKMTIMSSTPATDPRWKAYSGVTRTFVN
jgi:hypothetical protein